MEFRDPRGTPAEWVTEQEFHFASTDGPPVTNRTLYADEEGSMSWLRIGTLDNEGAWSVRLTMDAGTVSVDYPVSQLQLPVRRIEEVGVELRLYQEFVSDMYYSTLVSDSLVVDLQAHLAWVVEQLQERLGIQSSRIPDIYLAGSRGLFEVVSEATGREVGFEDGYYSSGGSRPGIYMRTDFFRTRVQRLLTHEYLHLVLGELADGRSPPAWLNEGLAEFYEHELGLEGEGPNPTRLSLYASADLVRSAARSGDLLGLPSPESQATWNSQTDLSRIELQYAEVHMAVRFLSEEYGAGSPIDMVSVIAEGSSISAALESVVGLSYEGFQRRFTAWIETWKDPERVAVWEYMLVLNDLLSEKEAISDRRRQALEDDLSLSQRRPLWTDMVSAARDLVARLEATDRPPVLGPLHEDAVAYLGRLVEWLGLELTYARTRVDSRRVEANQMIPEVNAREARLIQEVGDVEFVYWLSE